MKVLLPVFYVVKVLSSIFLFFFFSDGQDVRRLFQSETDNVRVTIVEAAQILPSFDTELQSYAEKKIKQRRQMELLQARVTSELSLLATSLEGNQVLYLKFAVCTEFPARCDHFLY